MQASRNKVLLALFGSEISPRFDLATEVLIAVLSEDGTVVEERTLVLPHPSAEKLCHMVVAEDIQSVICGGIEEEYYQYLSWKRVNVFDSVIGEAQAALECFRAGGLQSGAVLLERRREGKPISPRGQGTAHGDRCHRNQEESA